MCIPMDEDAVSINKFHLIEGDKKYNATNKILHELQLQPVGIENWM